jgi:4-amino-4-deoxy-L-arabinose transferase-like glycosyltransferase
MKEIGVQGRYLSSKKEYAIAFILFSVVAIVWFWGFNTAYFTNPDAYDYAQMGRELSNGNGFSTLQIFPRHIPFLKQKNLLEQKNWPNLHRFPLPTILNAVLYRITKDIIKAAILQSGIPFLLSIPVLFLLATRLTNPTVGIASTIFCAANPFIFESGNNGMSEALATFFILLGFLTAFSGKLSAWKSLALGVISGLGYLARTQLIMLLPLSICYIWITSPKEKRLHSAVLILVGFLVAAGPWFIRNTVITGNPTFSFVNSRALLSETKQDISDLKMHRVNTNLEIQLDAPINATEILNKYWPSVSKKVIQNILAIFSIEFWAIFFPLDGIFLFFFLASLIYRRHVENERYNFFRFGVIFLIIGTILIISILTHITRLYIPLQPLIYIIGINELFIFFDNFSFGYLKKLKPVVLSVMILFGLFRFYNTAVTHKSSHLAASSSDNASYAILRQTITPNSIVVSDISYKTALNMGCRSIRLPAFPIDIQKIDKDYLPVDYVLISSDMWPEYRYSYYSNFVNSGTFLSKFKFLQVLPNGAVLYEKLRQTN